MIAVCRDYLIQKLKSAGIKSKVCTSMKDLKSYTDSHVGAVIPDGDSFNRSFNKKTYQDSTGKHKRRKVFDRESAFLVVIGDQDHIKASETFDRFMTSLDPGIMIDGNYTEIIVPEAEWVDKDDSILKVQIAAQIHVKFIGGIYRDTDYAKVSNYEVISIEQEDRNGSK